MLSIILIEAEDRKSPEPYRHSAHINGDKDCKKLRPTSRSRSVSLRFCLDGIEIRKKLLPDV